MFQKTPSIKKSPIILAIVALVVLASLCGGFAQIDHQATDSITEIEGWPWFEDSYFNIKFQHPPDWQVRKLETTNYRNESGQGFMGEDAATAGPSRYKSWVLEIVPPWNDWLQIDRGSLGTERSVITIEQPNYSRGPISLYSNVIRPTDRQYESVLDPYSDGFEFNFTTHFKISTKSASTSVSFGHSRDRTIVGITALKLLANGYHFQPYITMSKQLGNSENTIVVFLTIVDTIQPLHPERSFNNSDYEKEVLPHEILQPN